MKQMMMVNNMITERAIDTRKQKDGANYAPVPEFAPGDTVIVAVRVIEGEKERLQNFKGIVLGRHGAGISQTFLVRKISNGVGVERIFPLFSPMIQSIAVARKARSRKAKLYYLRGMTDRKIRQKLNYK